MGDTFDYVLTITESHLVMAAGLFGDFNPLHVDETFASKSRFGGRILHGPFTSAFVAAPVGIYFSGTAIAYLEHSCRFLAPVKPGDTLRAAWEITDKAEKPKFSGGVGGIVLYLHQSTRRAGGDGAWQNYGGFNVGHGLTGSIWTPRLPVNAYRFIATTHSAGASQALPNHRPCVG